MYEQLARYYDLIHESLQEDIDFVLELAAKGEGPILELGCGTGRLLLPLARAGFVVTGVDNAPEMLAIARRRLSFEPEAVRDRVTLVPGDMRKFSIPETWAKYDLLLLPYNTMLHLSGDDIKTTLTRLRPFLKTGSLLFIDITNPYTIAAYDEEEEFVVENTFKDPESGGLIQQLSSSRLDSHDQVLHTKWIFQNLENLEKPAVISTINIDYHYQYPHQMDLLLQQSGFRLERMMGDYLGEPFTEESDRLLLLSRMK